MKKIKLLTIILAIVLISMVSFFGIYKEKQNRMENNIKEYSLSSDLEGFRYIGIKVNEDTKEIIKDSEGNTVEGSDDLSDEQLKEKGYTKESLVENQDLLNSENYNKSKKIIEKRLEKMGVSEYEIGLNEATGDMLIKIPENDNTDNIVSNIYTTGKLEIKDSETDELLLNNSDIETVKVMYGTSSEASSGTSVYLEIDFNKEGTKKYADMTAKYKTENKVEENTEENDNEENNAESEETENKEKKVSLKIDDSEILSTNFEKPIENGKLQLSVGSTSKDKKTLNDNIKRATNMATILDGGNLPLKYTISQNEYIKSDITEQTVQTMIKVIGVIVLMGMLIWIVKYKFTGLLSAITYIGFVASYLLTIRYTNVIISMAGIFGIIVILALNYILLSKFQKSIKDKSTTEEIKSMEKGTMKDFLIKIVPICIVTIVFSFVQWSMLSSFGMVMFWGIILIIIYNFVVTNNLIKISIKE